MTPSQQAELEQVARKLIDSIYGPRADGNMGASYDEYVQETVTLLAAQRATVLEEVAGETRRFTSVGAVAQWCRQQAKERS